MPHSITAAARILVENLEALRSLQLETGILDLACGSGRNGLFLARHNIPVTFADNNKVALDALRIHLQREGLPGKCWLVDFEQESDNVLDCHCFDGIIVFNYLHRALLPRLKQAVRPGGIVFYETFTVAQRAFGRPTNPDYLLQPGELRALFSNWQILHYFEGELAGPDRAIAQLIGKKPEQQGLKTTR